MRPILGLDRGSDEFTNLLSDSPSLLVYQYAHKERPVERARAACGGEIRSATIFARRPYFLVY